MPEAFGKILASQNGRTLYVQGLPLSPWFTSAGFEDVEVLVLHDVLLADLRWLERFPRLRELVLDHVRGGEQYRKSFVWESYAADSTASFLTLDMARLTHLDDDNAEAAAFWMHLRDVVSSNRPPFATLLRIDEVLSDLPVLSTLETLRLRVSSHVSVPADLSDLPIRFDEDKYSPPPSLRDATRQPNLRELHLDMSGGWLSLEAGPELRLERLEIRNAYVMSLEPLASQPTLRRLGLTSMVGLGSDSGGKTLSRPQPAMDLSPLASLSWLRELRVVNSSVAGLSFLAGMAELEGLDLRSTWVGDPSALNGPHRPCLVDLVGMPPHPYSEAERCDNACCRAGKVERRLATEPGGCKASCGGACEVKHHCTWAKQPEFALPWKRLWSDELSAGLTGLNLVEVSCE